MTPEEYVGRSNALSVEMNRIRGILDSAAIARGKYGIERAPNLIRKTHAELDKLVERFKALDIEFWGEREDE